MIKETKKRKRALIVGGTLLTTVVVGIGCFFSFIKEDEKSITQSLYDDAAKLMQEIHIPTYFDENAKNPIQNVFMSSLLTTESDKDGEKSNKKSDLLVDIIFHDEDTSQTVNYTVVNYSGEYEYVVDNDGEKIVLPNKQEVYKYQSGYFWKLTDELYASLFSHNENPNEEFLEEIILSVGDSKLNVFEKMQLNEKFIEPTYTIANDADNAYSVVMEYTQLEEKTISTLALHYDNFVMHQSYDVDYTGKDFMGDYTEEAFDKVEHNGVSAFVDKEYNSIHIKTEDDLSIWLLPNGEEVNKEEIIKVFQSLKF